MTHTNPKSLLIIIAILITSTLITMLYVPYEIEIKGGSCMQGITPMLTYLVLGFCLLLIALSIIWNLLNQKKKSITASTISLIIWLTWSIVNSISNTIAGIKYFSAFAIALFVCSFYLRKKIISNKPTSTKQQNKEQ